MTEVVKMRPDEWRDLGTLGQYVTYCHLCEVLQSRNEALAKAQELTQKAQDRAARLLDKLEASHD